MTEDAYFVDQSQRGTDLYRPAYGKKRLRKEKTHYVLCRCLLFSEVWGVNLLFCLAGVVFHYEGRLIQLGLAFIRS